MNDVSEIDYAGNLFLERLKASNVNNKHSIEEAFLKQKSELFNDVFILSVSSDGDSLPMWTYYGNNDGYNLEIDHQYILELKDYAENPRDKKGPQIEIISDGRRSFSPKVLGHNINYESSEQNGIFDLILSEISIHKTLCLGRLLSKPSDRMKKL